MKEERKEFINKTIRVLNRVEGMITDNHHSYYDILKYLRETRKKLEELEK
jgi:hypothetical protein